MNKEYVVMLDNDAFKIPSYARIVTNGDKDHLLLTDFKSDAALFIWADALYIVPWMKESYGWDFKVVWVNEKIPELMGRAKTL